MALQLRRGINSQRATTLLATGEIVYVTDNLSAQVSPLYVGDGSTTGGVPVVRVVSVNGETGAIALDTNDIPEGATNKYYLAERAQDDVAAALVNGVHTGITFTYNLTPQDSGNRIDAVVSASGTVNSGTANTLAYYAATGTAVSNTSSLTWNESTNNLTVDSGTLTVIAGNAGRPLLDLTTSANSVASNSLKFNKSRGTTVLQTAIASGDNVGEVLFAGHDGDEYITSAKITATVLSTVSNGSVPTGISFHTTNTDGILRQSVRFLNTGQIIVGPVLSSETGSGSLRIISTTNPGTHVGASIGISTYFAGADGQNFSVTRARGTLALPTPVTNLDDILDFAFLGYDGSNYAAAAGISAVVDGAVSAGIIPGALTFSVSNLSGAISTVVKINNPSGTSNGLLAVTGTVKASVALQTAVFADDAARNSTISVPSVGMIIFNTATGKFEGNTDGTTGGWVALN